MYDSDNDAPYEGNHEPEINYGCSKCGYLGYPCCTEHRD